MRQVALSVVEEQEPALSLSRFVKGVTRMSNEELLVIEFLKSIGYKLTPDQLPFVTGPSEICLERAAFHIPDLVLSFRVVALPLSLYGYLIGIKWLERLQHTRAKIELECIAFGRHSFVNGPFVKAVVEYNSSSRKGHIISIGYT